MPHSSTGRAIPDFWEAAESQRPYIFGFLLASTRDPDLAETLTQECLLKAYRHGTKFRGDSNIRTWLTRIAINLLKDSWRNRGERFWKQIIQNTIEPDDAERWLSERRSSPEIQYLAKERVRQIRKIVKTLSKQQRTVFHLRFFEELSVAEIARATGVTTTTIKAHLFRATSRIRSQMRAREFR